MDDNGATWTDIAGFATALASLLIALIAVILAIRTDRRSREVLKIQTYLSLRSRFIELLQKLGELEDTRPADDPELRLARVAYWHHSWDEWYLSERLSRAEFGGMWDGFFSKAMLAGLRHSALRQTLDDLRASDQAGFGSWAQEFIAEVERLEKASSPPAKEGDQVSG
ncbi:hypothetical protein JIG36_01650 [Actinoplanes sp. LDG1-06]|uniref:Uncharacterized protein n=1 Tax=Paractinoplanes ovalisporus TaxID=2810368 RepID=A0ABS2A4P6_9ACTN|nr:hypothetical protein [Actinoplanes ovalisporus]MBM2614258.1 hypothetical protein [Actinoplanes ovalisporus]